MAGAMASSCLGDLPAPKSLQQADTGGDGHAVDALNVPDLVAYWSFDQGTGKVARDDSGNGHDGRLLGPSWTADGKSQGALTFDGNASYVDAGVIDVAGEGLTLAAWVFVDGSAERSGGRILSKAIGEATQDHYWMLSRFRWNHEAPAPPTLRFRLKTDPSAETLTLIAPEGPFRNDEWLHAAATYDGARARLYLDGELVGSADKSGSIWQNNGIAVQIGSNAGGYDAWAGRLDEVVIFSRALDHAQLQQLMLGGPAALEGGPAPADSGAAADGG